MPILKPEQSAMGEAGWQIRLGCGSAALWEIALKAFEDLSDIEIRNSLKTRQVFDGRDYRGKGFILKMFFQKKCLWVV